MPHEGRAADQWLSAAGTLPPTELTAWVSYWIAEAFRRAGLDAIFTPTLVGAWARVG